MAQSRIVTGIDVGTSLVKVMVLRVPKDAHMPPKVIGVGHAEAHGLQNGYIVHEDDALRSIRNALSHAEKNARVPIKDVYLTVGGTQLETIYAHGETIATRPDQHIGDIDIDKAMLYSEESMRDAFLNAHILNKVPLRYTLDGREIIGRPQGLKGTKLEVDTLFITALEQQYADLVTTLEYAGVHVNDAIAAPLATSITAISKVHKRAGCLMVDIGAETTSIVVYENSLPILVEIFPVGSADLTSDIALAFKISLDEAARLKRSGVQSTDFSKKKLDEVMKTRYAEIFETIRTHLEHKKISPLLPGGVILTGGGAISSHAVSVARDTLDLPARLAEIDYGKGVKLRDPIWATVYGTCLFGSSNAMDEAGVGVAKKAGHSLIAWFKQFLP